MEETTGKHTVADTLPPPEVAEEFTLLMSLALDAMLDEADQRRFTGYLADFPALAAQWAEWQTVDSALATLPHMLPAPGFVRRFEERLVVAERLQQRRVMTFALVVVGLAVAGFVAAMLSAGVFVASTQGPWLGAQLRNLVYATNLVDTWFGALLDTASAVASSPQARAAGFAYLALAFLMIGGWLQLLQRSAHLAEPAALSGME